MFAFMPKGGERVQNYSIHEMPQDVMECRDFGHSWQHEWTVVVTTNMVERMLSCRRCDTLRRDVVDPKTGDPKGRSYAYGPGYQVLGHHLRRSDVRREAIRRALATEPSTKTLAKARK